MSNPNSPFGFLEATAIDGATTNYGFGTGKCLYSSGPLGKGDILQTSAGYLAQATVSGGGAAVAGTMIGAKWVSIAQGKTVWAESYPGNDSVGNADVEVYFLSHPNSILLCQPLNVAAAGAVTQAKVGLYANYAIPVSGAATTGGHWKSGFALDDNTITSTKGSLPLQIIALEQPPATDPTSAFNLLRVAIVNFTGDY